MAEPFVGREAELAAHADLDRRGGVSGNPISTIGFERRHNRMLGHADPDGFADALLDGLPPPPPAQQAIVEADLRGVLPTAA